MAFTLITIAAQFSNEDGTAAAGTVQFQLTQPMTNGTQTVYGVPLTVTLNGTGSISVPLYANDDATTTPTGTGYTVIERVTSGSNREYTITVPSAAPGGTASLSSLMPGKPGFG